MAAMEPEGLADRVAGLVWTAEDKVAQLSAD